MKRLPEGFTGRDDVADVHIPFYCRTLFIGTVELAEIYSKCHGVFTIQGMTLILDGFAYSKLCCKTLARQCEFYNTTAAIKAYYYTQC